jgi:2-polyprenyl-6-methoxyphenol hydroxylase-like FAD-dependent oxidoreductase
VLNGNGPALKVVVVGGSLGGLFNAIALRFLGYEVEVFEKSSGLMKDRGAGIVFQDEVGEFLNRYQVASLESVVVPVRTRRYVAADGTISQEGTMPQAMTSWDALYRKLRAAYGDDHYHTSVRLLGFDATDEKVTARFDGGREEFCDLLIGADGPGSTVRRLLLPAVQSEYAGYVAWRGVVLEHEAPDLAAEFADRFTFFQAPHTHILCYLIPGPDGSLLPGQRRLNWDDGGNSPFRKVWSAPR